MKDSTKFLSESKEKQKQSLPDKLRQDNKHFDNWLKRRVEIRNEFNDEIARDNLEVISVIYYLFWVNNTEHIDEARKQVGYSYWKKVQFL